MQYNHKQFKITPYYESKWPLIRSLFCDPSPKHYDYYRSIKVNYLNCYTTNGESLNACGYSILVKEFETLYIRCKLELPNDPQDLIGGYGFNPKRVIEIAKKTIIPPALASGGRFFGGRIADKFINIAAALYRGDKSIDIFAPYYTKSVQNMADTQVKSNFY